MKPLEDNQIMRCKVSLYNPFFEQTLPFLAKLYKAAFKPRRRFGKRFIGKPAKQLFRFLAAIGFSGTGVFFLKTESSQKKIFYNARNTQFGAIYMPQNKPIYEPETSALLLRIIRPNDIFFDVGANWGWYSILIANKFNFSGQIHAFEPFPSNYKDLMSIVKQCNFENAITCHNFALAKDCGYSKMAFSDGIQNGLARLSAKNGVSVNLTKLDDLTLPNPNIIKIDAEDHELGVLQGAKDLLKSSRPFILIENWLHQSDVQITLAPLKFLKEREYCFFTIGWVDQDPNCIKTKPIEFSELALIPFIMAQRFQMSDQINILAIPSEKINQFRDRLN